MKFKKIYFLILIFIIWTIIQLFILGFFFKKNIHLWEIDYKNISGETLRIFRDLNKTNSKLYLIFVLITTFIYLQTWCIPGTFVVNLLSGALLGLELSFPICLLCNTLGAFMNFMFSKIFLKEIFIDNSYINEMMNSILIKLKIKNEMKKFNLENLIFFSSMRLFPMTPHWMLNISFPHIGVKKNLFCLSIMLGLIPWNYLICQGGDLLTQPNIKNTKNFVKLGIASILLLVLGIIRKKIKKQRNN